MADYSNKCTYYKQYHPSIPNFVTMASILESRLELPGVSLYYQIYGPENKNLPLLVVVPAGNGNSSLFKDLATLLSVSFRVVLYDRRAYTRSPADKDCVPTAQNLFTVHAEDLAALITHVSPLHPGSPMAKPVYVFTTSGSIPIVLDLLLRNPYIIHQAVLHDPVVVSLCDRQQAAQYWTLGSAIVQAARKNDFVRASSILKDQLYSKKEWKLFRSCDATLNTVKAITPHDLAYYFGTEIGAIKDYQLDAARLAAMVPCPKEKVVIVLGRDEASDLTRMPGVKLANVMQIQVERITGGHVGYVTHVQNFAEELMDLFKPSLLASRGELKMARL